MHERCQHCLTAASQNCYNARHHRQTALRSCVSDICMQLYDVSLQISPAAYLKANVAFHCRSAAAMGALRRLSGSPPMGHSQSAAPAVRLHGPAHLAGLRIEVSRQYQHVSSHPQSSAHVASVTMPAKLLHLFGTVFLIRHGLERTAWLLSTPYLPPCLSNLATVLPWGSCSLQPQATLSHTTAAKVATHSCLGIAE